MKNPLTTVRRPARGKSEADTHGGIPCEVQRTIRHPIRGSKGMRDVGFWVCFVGRTIEMRENDKPTCGLSTWKDGAALW